jgi:hypothetical protein
MYSDGAGSILRDLSTPGGGGGVSYICTYAHLYICTYVTYVHMSFFVQHSRAQKGGKQHGWGDRDMTQSTDTQKKTRITRYSILYLSLSFVLRIVEARSAAIFLSAQAQFRSQLPAD